MSQTPQGRIGSAVAASFGRVGAKVGLIGRDRISPAFLSLHELTPEAFRRRTELSYLGPVFGCTAALRRMRPRNRGHIINISSALAYRGSPLQAAYSGCNHAMRGFTAALRSELRHDTSAIGVSMIILPMHAPQLEWVGTYTSGQSRSTGFAYRPKAAADAVLRIARTRVREYWLGAPTVLTVLASMIAPALLDRYLTRVQYRVNGVFEPPHQRATIVSEWIARVGAFLACAMVLLLLGAAIF